METKRLKRFAQYARRSLLEQVSAKLGVVLAEDSGARLENGKVVKRLEEAIRQQGEEQVVERVAYIWFNRFCALRFMDVNRYNRIGVLSPVPGQFQPEILAEAKMGHVDESMVPEKTNLQIAGLLDGSITSSDPQQDAYRLLIVAVCNYWHQMMPFMFERIADYTELLMPDDLLSGSSILSYTQEALTPAVCKENVNGEDRPVVEVIGWLYQFYISEKKDEIFAGLKKNKKITSENIPAATQLFTPHYIVRYLVENSLGRLWMLNHPDSRLIERMDYYIPPKETENNFLKISSPEEIKICDPACGSGHMLTYAFDLLYDIYDEEGYDSKDIPRLILTHNLYGIEIDERAGELAAFALFMKARGKYRRFFKKSVQPNICILENVNFDEGEINKYMDEVGRDLFTLNLQSTLHQFREVDNFGSLIRPDETNVGFIRKRLEENDLAGNLFLFKTHEKVLRVLKQADYLSPQYHVVVANPPYMGGKGMNGRLKSFAQDHYKNSKSDLFAMFMERNLDMARQNGMVAMITMQSWMFLSSFEKLRTTILRKDTILSMAHLGPRAFDSIGGEVVSTTAFVLENGNHLECKGGYLRLVDGNSEAEKEKTMREAIKSPDCDWFYYASSADFGEIPGSPITYWVSKKVYDSFQGKLLSDFLDVCAGLTTGNTDKFLRFWHEVSFQCISFSTSKLPEEITYVPYDKGGTYRKWHGNLEYVLAYSQKSIKEMEKQKGFRPDGISRFFNNSLTWAKVSTSDFSTRFSSAQNAFDATSSSAFGEQEDLINAALILNSRIGSYLLNILNSTMVYLPRDVKNFPIIESLWVSSTPSPESFNLLVNISKTDWDFYETSWDFTNLPLLQHDCRQQTLKSTYQKLRTRWREMALEMQYYEEENNSIFIEAYGLQDELTPKVPLNEITLTCNPYYRYKGNKSEEELEALLLSDTMKEFLSYAVGCMFGRYTLDKPGLILANQGETLNDYLQQIPKPSFPADEDNVIPILDQDWFSDDLTSRFSAFLKVTFGEEHYEENLKFITDAIGKDIRKYFLKDFYKDHLKTYKKRPIYWLFSSPKGSFNALIYMHRYRPDTVSVILNDYLREFRTKLQNAQENLEQLSISADATKTEKTKALKQIEKLKKTITELDTYENDTLYPLATQNIEIDLDDGVKVNYKKFGKALKKVPGLS